MEIGRIDLDRRVLVVAEIGNNHEGDSDTAHRLVRAAADAGADAVKLQTFRTEHFASPSDPERFERLRSFELDRADIESLQRLASSLGLLFVSTPLDLDSAAFLEPLVDAYKIASADNLFYPLLELVAATGKPVIVSAGLSSTERIERSVAFLRRQWSAAGLEERLAVLHCVSSYPAPPESVNLASIGFLREQLGCPVGYSDHTLGIEVCELAVAAGARVVEKHFTLDKQASDFRDHQLSADPDDLRQLVERIRRVEEIVGSPGKAVQPAEAELEPLVARSLVAAADLPAGHVLERCDLAWTRPGGGLAPGEEGRVLGKALLAARHLGERILPGDVG